MERLASNAAGTSQRRMEMEWVRTMMFSRESSGSPRAAFAAEGGGRTWQAATCQCTRQAASYARTIRGGRSGPPTAKASTVGTTAANTVGVAAGAGIVATVFRIALTEQHEAQALHFCLSE